MPSHICSIVPPYLLRGIVESQAVDDEARQCARNSLDHRTQFTAKRCDRFNTLSQPRAARASAGAPQGIVPEVLLQHIADSEDVDEETRTRARGDIERTRRVISSYQNGLGQEKDDEGKVATAAKSEPKTPEPSGFYRAVYDAKNDANEEDLPGTVVRVEGQQPVKDQTANDAFDNVGRVLDFYLEKFNWKSIDNKNMHVLSSVHFGEKYGNAFWDPDRMQMVFGDGDQFIYRFASCLDVIGHELTHAVTEHTSPLVYEGQPGALNEHVSDVFGIMIKQKFEDETADKADWLIGEGCLLPDVKGVALRSMKEPGTAYDDPRFGKDPQPANMADYKATTDDNGGVHLYSGIPNKAFYLASVAFGGYSWEKAGQVWWKAMSSGRVPARCTFIQFADVTTDVAEELFGEEGAKIVRNAWNEVGVTRKH
ncbi:metalloprotease [Parachaetomium inaequale]|uniref:Metalloprotease n=1 Tax=Parachaetomium inaequale TaxID=2588326 RepID=A0AAN6SN52_9PEZI|nr:metalloprotease [Parachaetomium inaequale]